MSEDTDRREGKPPHLDRLSALWRRLNDHKIVQWSVAYVALAYAIQHAIILTGESYEWPNIVPRVSMTLFALGLPLAITFAWYHGARASRNFSQAELSILAALLVTSSLLFYVFVRPAEQAAAPAVQQASVAAARSAAASLKGAISLAVLPFVNLSSDKEQEFFSDGMTEEITSALAKIPDLRVVGRTSAFQFKGENKDLRAIGQSLSATHLIEGSVRKAGNRVRITAQLIKSDDGTHIWSNDYDRELTDVFAIQEDIARAIATSLRMPLGLKPGEQLVSDRAIGPEDYQQYLLGKAALLRGRANFPEQIKILEPLVAHNPNYAPGWVALARAYAFGFGFNSIAATQGPGAAEAARQRDDYLQKVDRAARRAVELDPESPEGLGVRAAQEAFARKWAMAEELYSKALAIDQTNPFVLTGYTQMLLGLGRIKDALRIQQQLHDLEPFVGLYAGNLGEMLWLDGQTDAAIAIYKENLGRPGAGAALDLARIYASFGRYTEAADLLSRFPPAAGRDVAPAAVALLRTAPAKTSAPQSLPRLGQMWFVYLTIGAPERALEYYESSFTGGLETGLLWHPSYAALRKTDRFKKIARDLGYVDYWRAKGWPAQCHPTTGDDFACN